MDIRAVCGIAAAAMLGFAPTAVAAAGNFAFAVPGGRPGLDLTVTGYDDSGAELFSERVSSPRMVNGQSAYVVNVDETIVRNTTIARWCVVDHSGTWEHAVAGAPETPVCDDQPHETGGTFLFEPRTTLTAAAPAPAAASRPVPAMSEAEAVTCVQANLNVLGFPAGAEDGQLGRRTRTAAETYLAVQPAGTSLPPLEAAVAAQWCVQMTDAIAARTAVAAGDTPADLHFGPDVGAGVRASSAAAIADIADFFKTRLDYALVTRPAVYISGDAPWLTDAYLRERHQGNNFRPGKLRDFEACNGGEAAYRLVFMCSKSDVFTGDWFKLGAAKQEKFALTHEYFHMIQFELAGERAWSCCTGSQDSVLVVGPQWLVEGSAEYMAFRILKEGGWRGFDREIDWHTQKSRETGKPLSALVSRKGFYAEPRASSAGMIAVHLLVETRGIETLPRFWQAMAGGAKWTAAFETAFGVTPEAFDTEFADYIAN